MKPPPLPMGIVYYENEETRLVYSRTQNVMYKQKRGGGKDGRHWKKSVILCTAVYALH